MLWIKKQIAKVYEFESGDLLISHAGKKVLFRPNFDFYTAVKRFEDFSESYGRSFFNEKDGIDWFPAIQYFLFHKFVLPSVLYKDALAYIEMNKLVPFFDGGSKFRVFYRVGGKSSFFHKTVYRIAWKIERYLIEIHNRYICREYGEMFFQYSAEEMRLKSIRAEIKKLTMGLTAIGGDFRTIIKHFFNQKYFFVVTTRHDLIKSTDEGDAIFLIAEGLISQMRLQIAMYQRIFDKRSPGPRFFGIDDTLYLFPLLFVLNRLGVKTVGFQHGLYSTNDFGYAVRSCVKFEWYSKLVVWDNFWKKVYCKINPYYPEDSVFIGVGHEQLKIKLTPNPNNRCILCMYELFLNVDEYSYYLKALISSGFRIIIKLRPQSNLKDIATEYRLTDLEMLNVELVDEIDTQLISRVSIIAGCKTSLLYSLINVNRPVWIFETSYHYLEEVINSGGIQLIKKNDIKKLEDIYKKSINEDFQVFTDGKCSKKISDLLKDLDNKNGIL